MKDSVKYFTVSFTIQTYQHLINSDILGEAARFSMMTGRRDSLSLIGSGNLSEWVYLETK